MIRTCPDWAKAMVRNWRDKAKIDESVSDDSIFTYVEDYSLHYSSSMTDEEILNEVNTLRSLLELPELEEL